MYEIIYLNTKNIIVRNINGNCFFGKKANKFKHLNYEQLSYKQLFLLTKIYKVEMKDKKEAKIIISNFLEKII